MAHLEDFGEKIGGARKDLWKTTVTTETHFSEMNEMERASLVRKENIWIKPDWEKLIADGTPQPIAYWQSKMRQSLPPNPPEATESVQKRYIAIVSAIRDAVMEVKDQYDIRRFYKDYLKPEYTRQVGYGLIVENVAEGIVTNKVLKAAQLSYSRLERDAKKKLFGIPKENKALEEAKYGLEVYCFDGDTVQLTPDDRDPNTTCLLIKNGWCYSIHNLRSDAHFKNIDQWEKGTWFVMGKEGKPLRINLPSKDAAESFIDSYALATVMAADIEGTSKEKEDSNSNRKKNFVPPQLANIRYTGPDYRRGHHAKGHMFLNDLKFRGGEYGNWLNANDRQTSLDMAYDALKNLAEILNIPPEDVSLNGALAIAFGARGRGGASAGAAHYEPLRQVINLTKMSGAGCLAHEWGHALDHAIGLSSGIRGFATEAKDDEKSKLPASFASLVDKLRYKETLVPVEQLKLELDPEIKDAQKNLHNWIASVKPYKLPEDLSQAWDAIEKRILDHPESFSGSEYFSSSYVRGQVITHPDVEALSQIRKYATNHVIPRNAKQQITLWARDLKYLNERAENLAAVHKKVKTDFYQGSIAFDNIYSKYGNGYWQSQCEMFARAFDCYIADKIREQGYHSDYLSFYADSFRFGSGDTAVAAYPVGEERKVINQAFDDLIMDLKERGLLHEAPVVDVALTAEPVKTDRSEAKEASWEPQKPVRYEQLSLDELLFSAASRVPKGGSGKQGPNHDHSR